eukprot:SAG31_NODE_408_length_16015_cov_77.203569_8_plen_100_part_00
MGDNPNIAKYSITRCKTCVELCAMLQVVVRNKNPGDVHELPLSDLSRFLEAVGDPLGTSEVPCPPRLLNMYLHEVEDICPARAFHDVPVWALTAFTMTP